MLSDRVPWGRWGSRKPYMAVGMLIFALCYLALSQIRPQSGFLLFATLTWIASFGLAMFDTCADGWALDVTDENEQSIVQAAMVVGKSIGLITMSFLFGTMAERAGYAIIFQTLAGLSFLVLSIVLLMPYRPRVIAKQEIMLSEWSDLLKGFYLFFAAYGVIYSIASFGTDGLVTLHLADVMGAGAYEIGIYGMLRGLGALLGAGFYVVINRRFGMRNAQILSLIMLGAGCLLPLIGIQQSLSGVLWGICWGFQETAFVTLAMRFAEGEWAATFFAISMIFSNLGTSIGEALAAPLVPRYGYAAVFSVFALVAWSALLLVPKMLGPLSVEEPALKPAVD